MRNAEVVPDTFEVGRIGYGSCEMAYWLRRRGSITAVFLHGNSASKAAFRRLLGTPALADWSVLALDLPGCGESSDAEDALYTIPSLAEAVATVIETLMPVPTVLVGWSLGGHIALEALGQRPGLAHSLVLTGTPPAGPGAAELLATFRANELMEVTSGESPTAQQLEEYVRALYGEARPIDPELFRAAHRCHGRLRKVFAEHWMSGVSGHRQREIIREWPGRIAVIQGGREPFFDPAVLGQMQWNRLWRARVHSLEEAGHAPFYERPGEYATVLAEFVNDPAT